MTPKFSGKPIARKKHRSPIRVPGEIHKGWMVAGFDISLSSVAGAAFAWDAVLKKMKGPAFVMSRWSPDDDYFARLRELVFAHEFILGMQHDLNVVLPNADIVIAVEEPFPAHTAFTRRGQSHTLKQAAEFSGAFLGGLIRGKYPNIVQVSNQHWRGLVASEISEATGEDVTTYPAKWRSGALATRYNCKPADSGKFRSQQWATDVFEPWIVQQGGNGITDYPPLINSKDGKKPRPETSRAKAFQPDDRFDALAIAEYVRVEAGFSNG